MVSEGYLAAGYEYVGLDDCWMDPDRDSDGRLMADRERFPSGMKALVDYVHSKGLKFALYQNYGETTCGPDELPGILHNEKLDIDTFAGWGIDYLKLSACNTDPVWLDEGFTKVGKYLNETGRPIVFACSWPAYQSDPDGTKLPAVAETCNLWRSNKKDIQDSWQSLYDALYFIGPRSGYYASQFLIGSGRWIDADMLLIGNHGLSEQQARVQMALWALMSFPLMISTDLATIKPGFRDILLNKDLIALNQDTKSRPGFLSSLFRLAYADQFMVSFWGRDIERNSKNTVQAYVVVNYLDVPLIAGMRYDRDVSNLTDYFHEDPDRTLKKGQDYMFAIPPSGVKAFKVVMDRTTATDSTDLESDEELIKIFVVDENQRRVEVSDYRTYSFRKQH